MEASAHPEHELLRREGPVAEPQPLSPLPLRFHVENSTDIDTARVTCVRPDWKQPRRAGSQADPARTTALLFVGGLACQGLVVLPSLGPGSHPTTRILHERQNPHPHGRPPRPSPSSLLGTPGNAHRAQCECLAAGRAAARGTHTPRGHRAWSGAAPGARAVARVSFKQHEEHLRRGQSEH